MEKNQVKGNWKELKGKVKKKWAKLTDDDLLAAEGNFDEIAGRLQKTYGFSKEKAEQEIAAFRKEQKLH
jgi:uncharacterized protein YjbJ (UPF0337 family)